MIKSLHKDMQIILLALFHAIWAARYLPSTWKEAFVVLVLKR